MKMELPISDVTHLAMKSLVVIHESHNSILNISLINQTGKLLRCNETYAIFFPYHGIAVTLHVAHQFIISRNCFVRRGYHIPLLLTGYLSQLICKAASGLKSQHIIARQDASLNHHFVCYLYSFSRVLMSINYATCLKMMEYVLRCGTATEIN